MDELNNIDIVAGLEGAGRSSQSSSSENRLSRYPPRLVQSAKPSTRQASHGKFRLTCSRDISLFVNLARSSSSSSSSSSSLPPRMPPFAAGALAAPNIPPPGPVANMGAPNTLIGLAGEGPGDGDPPKALNDETTLRGGEAGELAEGGEDGCSGEEGVGGAPGTGRRGGSLPPGV